MTTIFKCTDNTSISQKLLRRSAGLDNYRYRMKEKPSILIPLFKKKKKDLPTDSMQKSKVSSEASFLLDFSFPCRFTIFTNSLKKEKTSQDWKSKSVKNKFNLIYGFYMDIYRKIFLMMFNHLDSNMPSEKLSLICFII